MYAENYVTDTHPVIYTKTYQLNEIGAIARDIIQIAPWGSFVFLSGELGAGKTTLVGAIGICIE